MHYNKNLMESYRLSKENSEKELNLSKSDDEKAKNAYKKISKNRHKNEEKGLSL